MQPQDLATQQSIFKTTCKRRHMIIDKVYSVWVYSKIICIGEVNQNDIRQEKQLNKPKYNLSFSFDSRLLWKFTEDGKTLKSFGLVYDEKIKWFDCEPQSILELKAALGNKIFFGNISLFYDSLNLIGSGASCKVCQVLRKSDQMLFAAKCVSKKYLNSKRSPDRLTRLHQEIAILQILDHKNFVKLLEIYQGENSYYLITDLYNGDTLYKYIKTQSLMSEQSIKVIMRQIIEGLAYLDDIGIIHRDIKLENILFAIQDDINTIKIIDLGLAIYRDQKVKFSICGTPGYIAPEVLRHEEKSTAELEQVYTHKCDMFSVGVIFYKLLTKKTLFRGANTSEILDLNKSCQIDYSDLGGNCFASDEAINLLRLLLSNDVDERITAQQALLHPFFSENVKEHTTGSLLGNDQVLSLFKLYPCMPEDQGSNDVGFESQIQHLPTITTFLARRKRLTLRIDIEKKRNHLTRMKSTERLSPYIPSFSQGISLESMESPQVLDHQFDCGEDSVKEKGKQKQLQNHPFLELL